MKKVELLYILLGVTSLQLDEDVKKQIINIVQNYKGVKRVILFDSRARGDATERSDIDLAIDGKNINEGDWLNLYFELREDLDSLLSTDVVLLHEASEELKKNIEKEGCVLYDKAKTEFG